jgi:hypothetical protein
MTHLIDYSLDMSGRLRIINDYVKKEKNVERTLPPLSKVGIVCLICRLIRDRDFDEPSR